MMSVRVFIQLCKKVCMVEKNIKLSRDKSSVLAPTEVIVNVDFSNVLEFSDYLINLYEAIINDKEKWVTKQERLFFKASIIIANKGIKYTSSEAKLIYKEIFRLKRQSDVRGYLVDLENKGLLKSNTTTKLIDINPFFLFNLDEQIYLINCDLKLKTEDEIM